MTQALAGTRTEEAALVARPDLAIVADVPDGASANVAGGSGRAADDTAHAHGRAGVGASPAVEFLLVGGLTPLLYPLSWALRRAVGLDAADLAVGATMFYAATVINDPHFAVTYLLFYRGAGRRAFGPGVSLAQRARVVGAGVVVPAALAAWAIAALAVRSAPSLGLLIQLMFFLVGWHYVKQGFGVMTLLSARRGVTFSGPERAAILAHALAGWAYAWANPADVGREVEEKGVVYTTLAHGKALEGVAMAAALGTLALVVVMLAAKFRREGRLPVATPLVAYLSTIWAWSVFSSVDPLVRYVTPALHSVQYLYVVWLLKHGEARALEGPPHFEAPAWTKLVALAATAVGLGWLLFHGAPGVLDAALVPRRTWGSDMGPTPYLAAIYAFVNIHHYVMDAVIWRRENPDTRYLRQA